MFYVSNFLFLVEKLEYINPKNNKFIFNILFSFLFSNALLFIEIQLLYWSGSCWFSDFKGFIFLLEFTLDQFVLFKVALSLSLRDLLTNFFAVFIFKINTELGHVFIEILFRWVANSLGLFNEVIFNFKFTVEVILIGFFIHNWLICSLIVKSFSHMLVLFKSNCLCNESWDNFYEFLIGVLLVCWSCFSFNFLNKLVFVIEKFFNVIFSHLSQVFVDLGFSLRFITKSISMWVQTGAKFLGERDNTSSWSDRTKDLENITGCHIVIF